MGERRTSFAKNIGRVAVGLIALAIAASASATLVWDLNPNQQNGAVGATSATYTSQGVSLTAFGFDNNAGIGSAQQLWLKSVTPINGAAEVGLGVANTADHEIQAGSPNPFDFIQFDLSLAIKAGATTGRVSVSSIQSGESFAIFGSNTLGTLGAQLGGTFGSNVDNTFVDLPSFGQYNYYSIAATANDVLPVALSADIPPVPEMNALLPIVGLVVVIGTAEVLRRRRNA